MGRPDQLPVHDAPPPPPRTRWARPLFALLCVLLLLPALYPASRGAVLSAVRCPHATTPLEGKHNPNKHAGRCVQPPAVAPSWDVSALMAGKKDRIVTWLSNAVKIPTEIFDVMGPVGEDKRWDVFYEFAEYLEKAFPLTHAHLTRTRVMTHALVYEWEGSDKSLKPLLLAAHQDVVPVLADTRDLWTHDPYGGEYDGTYIWGRGSMDDKSGLIGALAAIELLLESGKFSPARTVILALGCDEETGGKVGAYHMGQWLEQKYGADSMAMLIDEGGGMAEVFGQMFALPAVAEKGYLDVELKVETLGGHSSIPPPHTGIGYAALALAEVERNPHTPYLNPESPLVSFLGCTARYADAAPKELKRTIKRVTDALARNRVDKKALKQAEKWWAGYAGTSMIATTQAIDIIRGGVKVNALPEVVVAYINHRISLASSVAALQERITGVLKPVAKAYGLDFEAFGETAHTAEKAAGKLTLSQAFNSSLNPAPVSPYTADDAAWRVLAGTTKSVYATRPDTGKWSEEVHMAPYLTTGNTDTKRYWNLTRNIYRFAYLIFAGKFNNAHTVDEYIEADMFVEQVRWFANFIVNVDETREI